MNTFDRSKHPAGPDGRFVTRTASDPEVSLGSPAVPEEDLVHPSGCAICGEDPRTHGLRIGGGHAENMYYVEPTAAQRKERIIASISRQKAVREGRGGAGTPEEDLVHPSGCAICGGLQGSHGLTSKGGRGNHYWQVPSLEQRKERITAAAEARKAAVAEGRKGFHFNPPLS